MDNRDYPCPRISIQCGRYLLWVEHLSPRAVDPMKHTSTSFHDVGHAGPKDPVDADQDFFSRLDEIVAKSLVVSFLMIVDLELRMKSNIPSDTPFQTRKEYHARTFKPNQPQTSAQTSTWLPSGNQYTKTVYDIDRIFSPYAIAPS